MKKKKVIPGHHVVFPRKAPPTVRRLFKSASVLCKEGKEGQEVEGQCQGEPVFRLRGTYSADIFVVDSIRGVHGCHFLHWSRKKGYTIYEKLKAGEAFDPDRRK